MHERGVGSAGGDREPARRQYRDRRRARRQNAARRLHPVRRDGCHDGAQSHHRQQPVLRSAQGFRPDHARIQEHVAPERPRRGWAEDRERVDRARQGQSRQAHYGAGIITTRLAGYLFNREAGLDVQYIPFNGSAPTVQGLLTGTVDYIIDGAATSLPLIQSGKLRALAKLNSRPLPALPEVRPLAVEAGIPALDDISTWIGLVAPAGTPRPIVDKIQREVVKMYADPVIAEKLEKSGISAASSTPEEFDAFVRKELDRWDRVFKDSGIKLN